MREFWRVWPKWRTSPLAVGNLRQVAPELWVGDAHSPRKGRWALVVDLIDEYGKNPHRYANAVRVLSLPISDGEAIPEAVLGQAVHEVMTARRQGRVLIHCAAGLSRSASIAYAVLRYDDELPHAEALRRVQTPGVTDWPHPTVLASARDWVRRVRA